MKTYLSRHLQVLFATLGAMKRTPLATLSTIVIISISLLLPSLLYITLKSGAQLTSEWQGQPQISIFLQHGLSANESQLIYDELRLHPAIQIAELITPSQALAEFKTLSGLNVELGFLEDNPLPASVVVLPNDLHHNAAAISTLRDELTKIEGIDDIRLDLEWTDRYHAILSSLEKFAKLLSILLSIALILTIGNTVKLLIMNRRQEIEITKLVGGSNRFVRRPFLYFGALFGFFGALISLLLLVIVANLMQQPLFELSSLYQRESVIYQPNWQEFGALTAIGVLLGWLAARISVAQHLNEIKPR